MSKLTSNIRLRIDSIKETSWSTIILFSTLYCIYVTFCNLVVFKNKILAPISSLTLGLINETLVINIVSIVIFVFIIILKYGKLSFFDIGFKKNRVLTSIIIILAIWISVQLVNIIAGLITLGKPIINHNWSKYGVLKMFGSFIDQIFGNALFEELAFRGFLFVQIYKKIRNTKVNFFIAVVGSQLIFSIIHIPNRIYQGMNILEILPSLIIVLILGVLFALLYLVTDNIFLVIGIHALLNSPLVIFDGSMTTLVILILMIILILSWDKIFNRFNFRFRNTSSYID